MTSTARTGTFAGASEGPDGVPYRHRHGRTRLARPSIAPPLGVCAVLVILGASVAASAQSVVEARLAELQPCRGLTLSERIAGLPIKIGIERLERVSVRHARVDLEGDEATLVLDGGLACQTAEGAPFAGNAAIELEAEAALDLAACEVHGVSIVATSFGGSLAPILEAAWEPLLRPLLEAEGHRMLAEACVDLRDEP